MGAPGLNSVSDMPLHELVPEGLEHRICQIPCAGLHILERSLGSLLRSSANSTVSDTALLPVL